MLDWYLEAGWLFIQNKLVLSTMLGRNLFGKKTVMRMGIKDSIIPDNLLNLERYLRNDQVK